MEYILKGKVSLDDYIQFNKTYQKHGFLKIFRITIYAGLFILLIFLTISDFELFSYLFINSPLDFVKILIPFIIVIISLIIFNTAGMRMIYKIHYKKNKLLQQNQNIKINEQQILIEMEYGNNILTKDNINKILFDHNSFYIYTGVNIGFIFKKRFLEKEDEFEELINFIKLNYNKN